MNHGSLNTSTLNGWAADVTQRSMVRAVAAAVVAARGRALRYAVLTGQPLVAEIAGVVGRKWARSPLRWAAYAAGESLGRVGVRTQMQAVARAAVGLSAYLVARAFKPMQVRAQVKAAARIHAYGRELVRARAQAVASARACMRSMVVAQASADVEASSLVKARGWVGDHLTTFAQVHIQARLLRMARAAVRAAPEVALAVRLSGMLRAPAGIQAEAVIRADARDIKRMPFDEPAPSDRVFVVSPDVTVFYVVN